MPQPQDTARAVDAAAVARLYARAGAGRWELPKAAFAEALERGVRHRFGLATPSAAALNAHLDALHLDDLALAVACACGIEPAWDEFVARFRPVLYRAARTVAPDDAARELADSLYAELFGLAEREGTRRSRLAYYHGRSSLATWLRSVLAQRRIDQLRAHRRFEPLPDEGPAAREQPPGADDPKRARYLAALQESLAAAVAEMAPRDQLRLSCYYLRQMTLAEIGRLLGEHEATVSRKLARARAQLRQSVERDLEGRRGMAAAEVSVCFEYALEGWSFEIERVLPPPRAE
jgi:RNA polymerase sigma-70 factor, ECF subfamily